MFPVIIAVPTPCPGAYDCIWQDVLERVGFPEIITTLLFYGLLFAYLWIVRKRKQLKDSIPSLIQTALFTALAGAIYIVLYSPYHQYQNLKGQYDDAIKARDTAEAILKQARADQIGHQSIEGQLGAKIDALNKDIKVLQEKDDEILRNLPKPKGK